MSFQYEVESWEAPAICKRPDGSADGAPQVTRIPGWILESTPAQGPRQENSPRAVHLVPFLQVKALTPSVFVPSSRSNRLKTVSTLAQGPPWSDPRGPHWSSVRSEGTKQWNIPKLQLFLQAWTYLVGVTISCEAIVDGLALLQCNFLCLLFLPAVPSPELVTWTDCFPPAIFRSGSSFGMGVMMPSLQGYCESKIK